MRGVRGTSPSFRIVNATRANTRTLSLIRRVDPSIMFASVEVPIVSKVALLAEVHSRFPFAGFIVADKFSSFRCTGGTVALGISSCLLGPMSPSRLRGILLGVGRRLRVGHSSCRAMFTPNTSYVSPKRVTRLLGGFVMRGCTRSVGLGLVTKAVGCDPDCLAGVFYRICSYAPAGCLVGLQVDRTRGLLVRRPSLSMGRVNRVYNCRSRKCFDEVFGGRAKGDPLRCGSSKRDRRVDWWVFRMCVGGGIVS